MKQRTDKQVDKWLKKLERESWQLELLVSAFTIFLLIAAQKNFGEFIISLTHEFHGGPIIFLIIFLSLIHTSIIALTGFLIIHLLIRGFWIGAIGLRSVQASINYQQLNYSEFFQEKLKKKVMGLDRQVALLDELCSVIFSVSFLIVFMLVSFGLYLLFILLINGILVTIVDLINLEVKGVVAFSFISLYTLILLSGIIYLIDYFTLGFFKRHNRLSKAYYPIYKFYSAITLSFLSRSIYYNLISKYSKKTIRILLSFFLILFFSVNLINFDQHIYFPNGEDDLILENNYYEDLREEDKYIEKASVASKFTTNDYISLFIRYDPSDNVRIKSNCPDFTPLKNEGINSNLRFELNKGLQISNEYFKEEDKEMLLHCLSAYYEISINDSIYTNLSYHFYTHPAKNQRGLITVFSTDHFNIGQNTIRIKTKFINSTDSSLVIKDLARIPIWYSKR